MIFSAAWSKEALFSAVNLGLLWRLGVALGDEALSLADRWLRVVLGSVDSAAAAGRGGGGGGAAGLVTLDNVI